MTRIEAWCFAVAAAALLIGLISSVYQMGGIG